MSLQGEKFVLSKNTRALTTSDWRRMGVGRAYWDVQLDRIPRGKHRDVLSRWIEGVVENVARGWGLFIRGEFRTGKTSAAVLLMKSVVEHKGTAYLLETPGITSDWIENTVFDEEQTVKERILAVDLLVMDDLGLERGQEFTRGLIEHTIRHRAARLKPTVITTNLSLKEVTERYGRGFVEIVRSYCYPIEMHGKKWSDAAADDLRRSFE